MYVKRSDRCAPANLLQLQSNSFWTILSTWLLLNLSPPESARDLDYMRECASRGGLDQDPFLMTTACSMNQMLLREIILQGAKEPLEMSGDASRPQMFGAAPCRNHANQQAATAARCMGSSLALSGDTAFLLPVVVMVLVPGKATSLIVTSVFTMAFAAVVA